MNDLIQTTCWLNVARLCNRFYQVGDRRGIRNDEVLKIERNLVRIIYFVCNRVKFAVFHSPVSGGGPEPIYSDRVSPFSTSVPGTFPTSQ